MIHTLLITSSVLILGVFCVRKLSFGRIAMRARYALWLPVAVRLLFPFSVGESSFSVMNVFPAGWTEAQMQTGAEEHDAGQEAFYSDGSGRAAGEETEYNDTQNVKAQHTVSKQILGTKEPVFGQSSEAGDGTLELHTDLGMRHTRFLRLFVCGVWGIGFLAVGGHMLFSRQRFLRYLKKNRSPLSEEMLTDDFAKRFLARGMKVYQVQGLPSPCLVGRDIYIGSRAAALQSLPHILAHEYSHALHLDGLWAFVRSFLTAVYWFDPLVWAAAHAARQDSELACDEAAVALLGESERFAYGRTLLNLLENGDERKGCPGMSFLLDRGEKGVRERIAVLAGGGSRKRVTAVLVLAAALLLCGCAFTGAAKNNANGTDEQEQQEELLKAERLVEEEAAHMQEKQEELAEAARLVKEQKTALQDEMLKKADQAAFEEVLNYHGVMEGKDDGELALNRQLDFQTYYRFTRGEAENPMVNGWYLLCQNEDAGISLYGLYTEEFGFRGLKTLIGEDVNTFDVKWCASLMIVDDNIRVLEQAQDGLPRRFVWKLLAEESGTTEIWRFYSAYRYDTGTVEVKTLTEEDCLAWAKEHLSFTVDQEAAEVDVICDGDMYLGAIDISADADLEVEEAQIVSGTVGFTLDDPGGDIYQAYSDAVWEKTALHLVVGLKFSGIEGLWWDRIPVLTVQIAEDEDSTSGFRLGHPRIDETYVSRMPGQERKLAELRDGTLSAQTAKQADGSAETDGLAQAENNDLEKPLINEAEAHHDLAIDFSNPCPSYEHISAWYGEGIDPATEKPRAHTGVDMAADEGADILAAADGKVFRTGFDAVNGNYVVLWHGQSGQMTYYAHCKTVEVAQGQQVAQGEKIATVGQTGQATGSCLHFAISSEDNWEEPHFLELE